jgi:hypothetical protein
MASPLGIIPSVGPENFKYGDQNQASIFSSKHIIRKTSNPETSPLSFGEPKIIHKNDVYDISTSNIITQLEKVPSMSLKWSDFAYCRDYGVYPNNRLVICRRFPAPVLDDLTGSGLPEPMTTLVSWMGEDVDLLNFSFGEKWGDAEATFTNILNGVGKDIGLEKGSGIKLGNELSEGGNLAPLPGATEILQRNILQRLGIVSDGGAEIVPSGTPNLIKEAKQRKLVPDDSAGSGLTGKFTVAVKCAWEQKFISGVDPTFIYYDILRTVLSFGGSDAVFYLGKKSNLKGLENVLNRFTENPASVIRGIVEAIKDEVLKLVERISKVITNVKAGLKEAPPEKGIVRTVIDVFRTPNNQQPDGSDATNVLSSVVSFIGSVIKTFTDTLIKKYKVQLIGVVSALTGLPSTPWHVTIGNPLRPILVSGDMLCNDVTVNLGKQLSFNDLPSYIECTFTLTSARELGIDEIFEKLTNGGLRISEDADSYWNKENSTTGTQSNTPTGSQGATNITDNKDESVETPPASDGQSKTGNVNAGNAVNPDAISINTTTIPPFVAAPPVPSFGFPGTIT